METPYITVTLELAGHDTKTVEWLHDQLRQFLRSWHRHLSYGELRIAYQDQAQMVQEAQVDAYAVDDEGLGHVLDDGGVCVPGCPGCRG